MESRSSAHSDKSYGSDEHLPETIPSPPCKDEWRDLKESLDRDYPIWAPPTTREEDIDKVTKENYGLKLKIHFYEEKERRSGGRDLKLIKDRFEAEVLRREQADADRTKLQEEVLRLTTAAKNGEVEGLHQVIKELKESPRRRDGSRSTAGDYRSAAGDSLYGAGDSIYDRSASRAGRSASRDSDMTRNTQMSDDERDKYEIRIGELRDQISEVKLRNLDYGDEIKRLSREVKRHQEEKQALRADFDRASQQCDDWMDRHERNIQGLQAMQIERDEALRQTKVLRTNFQDLKKKAEQATQGWKDLVDQLARKLKQQEAELRSEKEETQRLRAGSARHHSSSTTESLERSSTNPLGREPPREPPQKPKQQEAEIRSEKEGTHRLRAAFTRNHSSTAAENLERSSTNPFGRELPQKLKQQEGEPRSEKAETLARSLKEEETHRIRPAFTRHDSSATAENLERSSTNPLGRESMTSQAVVQNPLGRESTTSQAVVHGQHIELSEQRWIHRLRELERRLKAEREARLLDRSGARKRLEEGRAENEELRKRLELERMKREMFDR